MPHPNRYEIMSESGIGPLDMEEWPGYVVVDTHDDYRVVARFTPDMVENPTTCKKTAPRIQAWREAKRLNEANEERTAS